MNLKKPGFPVYVKISLHWADKLSPTQLRAYIAIKVMQEQGQKISYESLANAMGFAGKLSARGHLQSLMSVGLVTRFAPLKRGRGHSYTYRINDGISN